MNWKALLTTIAHAAIGGGAVAATQLAQGNVPLTGVGFALPIAASAITSVLSLFAQSPTAAAAAAPPSPPASFPQTK